MNRRDILKNFTLLPLVGGVAGTVFPFQTSIASPTAKGRDVFKELGVRTFINAAGTYTMMTGSLMHDYVVEAIEFSFYTICNAG
jgi:L-seryl-tRNA(Ser) seleniumtransferase